MNGYAEAANPVRDTLFFVHSEEKTSDFNDTLRTLKIKMLCKIYCSQRVYVKRDSIMKPTRVVVSFVLQDMDNSDNLNQALEAGKTEDLFSRTILMIHQLYAARIRTRCYATGFSFRNTSGLVKIIESEFGNLKKREREFREDTGQGKFQGELVAWHARISNELEQAEKKH